MTWSVTYGLHDTFCKGIPSYHREEAEKFKLLPQEITGGRTKSAQVSRAQVLGYQDRKVGSLSTEPS